MSITLGMISIFISIIAVYISIYAIHLSKENSRKNLYTDLNVWFSMSTGMDATNHFMNTIYPIRKQYSTKLENAIEKLYNCFNTPTEEYHITTYCEKHRLELRRIFDEEIHNT